MREIGAVPGRRGGRRATDVGIATGNSSSTGVQRPGRSRSRSTIGSYASTPTSSRRWGSSCSPGRMLRGDRAEDDATAPLPATRPRRQRGLGGARHQHRDQRARRQRARLRRSRARRSASRSGSACRRGYGGLGAGDDRRRRRGQRASARSATRSRRSCSGTSRGGSAWLLVRYDAPTRAAVQAASSAVWKRIAPDVPFEAEFSEDDHRRSLRARGRARAQTSPASPCSRC